MVVEEIKEADQIKALCAIWKGDFGYALLNGTVGVYANMNRVWRIKSKSGVNCICSHDLDGDGVPELLSGWGNGKVRCFTSLLRQHGVQTHVNLEPWYQYLFFCFR